VHRSIRPLGLSLAVLALLVAAPSAVRAADAADAADAAAPVPGFRGEVLRSLADARDKLVELAEATPEDKYGWRPGEGVRSTAEVFVHVAQANDFLPTLMGGKLPAGVTAETFEKPGDKAGVIALLEASFDNAEQFVRNTADADLDRTAHLFDHDGTWREGMLLLVTHSHEHLGQSIAYARMNGIVPPWTARQQAAQAAAQDKKGAE
jgi:uncharacterized damage-inducible protein DinB